MKDKVRKSDLIKRYGDECDFEGVKMDQTEFAEQTGYLTTQQLVHRFMEAGRVLSGHRKGLLDYEDSDDYDDDLQDAADIYDYDEPVHLQARKARSEAKILRSLEEQAAKKAEEKPQENTEKPQENVAKDEAGDQ